MIFTARQTAEIPSDPRTQIRGLIEAGCAHGCPATRARTIRGLRSAASLKPAGVYEIAVEPLERSADSDPRPH